MYMKPTLAEADLALIGQACLAAARQMQRRVTIAIVDDGGALSWFVRMDGAPATGAEIAPAKARLAALGRRDTLDYQGMVDGVRTSFLSALSLAGIRGAALEGGVAIIKDGHCLGAIGVAGAASSEDADIGRHGVAALPA